MKQILIDGRIIIRTIQIYIFNSRKTKQAPIEDACCRDSRMMPYGTYRKCKYIIKQAFTQ